MQSIQDQLAGFREKGRRFRMWKKVVTALACVVVFCTVYALILPAITLEGNIYCEKEEHTHSDKCYKEAVAGTEKKLVCTKEEVEPHTHSDGCYEIRTVEVPVEETIEVPADEAEPAAVSETGEAEEVDGSGATEAEPAAVSETPATKTVTVTKTEIKEEKVLVCEKAETEGHAHGNGCYEEVEVYGDPELDCSKEEHNHSKSCYSNPNADVETEAEWKKIFEDVTFTHDWVEDTLAIAKTQLGYNESNDNYIVLENGDTKGYTRYGEWYGDKYGDWCAMFVSFCLNYAEVEDFPLEAGCQNWILKIKELEEASKDEDGVVQYNAWQEATEDYMPERGNIIFFNWDSAADSDHVGIVVGTTTDENGNTTITTVEGNTSDTVRYKEYVLGNGTIMGYGILPDQEFYCGIQGHAHDEDCYNDANEAICGVEEHIHTAECEVKKEVVEEELPERVKRVIEAINKLPSYEEFEEKLLEYEDAEDMDGYEAYYMEISGQAFGTYVLYEDLSEEECTQVTNIDKLMEFEWLWSASTMQIEQGIEVYQMNSYNGNNAVSGAKTVLFHGMSPDEFGTTMSFAYWSAIVVEAKEDGTLYVSECNTTENVDKSGYGPKTDKGFVLFVHDATVNYAELDIVVGDIVSVPFDYTQTKAYTGNSYGVISFSDPKGNENKLTIVPGADTRDLITVNLYDYSTNINAPYNGDKNFPGFQQDEGQLTATSTSHSNFGNNITEDLEAGHEGITIKDGTNINATVDGGEGLANRPNSGMMLPTLGSDGYPALADGTSLQYLFHKDSGYATKMNEQSINGLFQQDEKTGAYTFNSRENHAQFNGDDDTFVLYDQLISSNFIWYPFGNFLPFNDIVHQTTQASKIDREYFMAVASKSRAKYNNGMGSEYLILANTLEDWIALMDAKYPNGWGGAQAMNEYFNNIGPGNKEGIQFDFSTETELLDKVYSIDYDEATDFYFGMEMYMEFMQPKDGLTGKTGKEPMVFYFTGDDDVWIYVDDKLFLDLSGIHRHVGGEIDFENGLVHYYALDPKTGDVSTTPYKTQTFAEILGTTNGLNAKGAFENYSTHTFNFYYMERGAGSGVCRMNFNFPLLRQNSISVTKELSVDDENVKELLGNPEFRFQVYKENGNELFIGADKEYEIYDETGQKVGTGVTDVNGIFTIKAGQTAVFSGIDENSGKYFVRELLDESVFEQYGKVSVDGQTTTTDSYTDITIGSDSFKGINSPLKDVSDGSTSFSFNNNVTTNKVGELKISKQSDDKDVKTEFTFSVKLDGEQIPVGTAYTIMDANGKSKNATVETAGIIKLKTGETAEISGILAGSRFEVQETKESAKGYTVQYSGDDSGTDIGTDADGRQFVSGVITPSTEVSVTVTNILKGTDVQIPGMKVLENQDGKEHIYQIELTEVTDQNGQTEVENGSAMTTEVLFTGENEEVPFGFTIPYKEKDIEAFPKDFFYKITETKDSADWTTQYDDSIYVVQVTVSKNEEGELLATVAAIWKDGKKLEDSEQIIFTNEQLFDLTLTKKFEGSTIDSDKEFTFEIVLSQNNSALSGTYKVTRGSVTEDIVFEEGRATVKLKVDESLTIHGLPYGATWSIKEIGADGYIVRYQIGEQNEVTNSETTKQTLQQCVEIIYTNCQSYELPETGGTGTNPFIMGGMALMCCALILLYNNKKCGKEETASS